jgi:23S rRNA pseudouridine2604 synthase
MNENIDYPIRINRYLALKGIAARREADELIKAGKVKINGKRARLGDQVHAGDDVTAVARPAKDLIYIAYNKPKEIVTHTPQRGERSIADELQSKFKEKLFPLGRLDKNSEGLIILTNDGRITDRLLNPEYGHEKEYLVKVNKPMNGDFSRRIQKGVFIEGYRTKEAIFEPTGEKSFRLIITEGKKHQIRRMCTALGYEVVALRRVRIMNIKLGYLPAGKFRKLEGKELDTFLKNLGID